ncbi:MAG: mechanosensitive ion channel [Bacteroidota bacterium]|nr:mechanosensitive ion channel [Bacteroidota bacterium]MDO9613251.1 mechanosensitive ion channel [Bacteroidota bacterium]
MIYIEVFAVAIALYLILRFVSTYFRVLTGKRKIRKIFLKVFPVVQMFLWFAFAFWAFDQLFIGMAAYPFLTGSLIILLVGLFGWYFLRDFVSGIILKAENAFETGQQIRTAEVSGTIKKLGYRSIGIVTSEGELVKIPYSLLASQKIVKPADTGNWVEQLIRLKISSAYPPEKIQNMLKIRLLEMPWIVSDDSLQLKITRDEAGNYMAEIHVHLLNPEMAIKTEENLRVFVREVFA